MALTEFQRHVCRLIANQRIASGESYVAGAVALNVFTGATRISRDIDVFHDTNVAVSVSFETDRRLLEAGGYEVSIQREHAAFVEAEVRKGTDCVIMQWAADSAFRFFPLVEHEDFGLTLHAFDLATNKVLALVGRVEARDWVDVMECDEAIQTLGFLAWAASGKDPGFSPAAILEQAARTARYSAAEVAALAFAGIAPSAEELSQRWHTLLRQAREIVSELPPAEVGKCVMDENGNLFRADLEGLRAALGSNSLFFHAGSLRGSLPKPLTELPPHRTSRDMLDERQRLVSGDRGCRALGLAMIGAMVASISSKKTPSNPLSSAS